MSVKNILITGGRTPAALHLCRLFSLAGHNVICAESLSFYLSKYSNHVCKNIKVTSPVSDLKKYKQEMIEIIESEKINLVIPTCEEAFYISKIKEDLEKHCKVCCEEIDKMDLFHNKYTFTNWAVENGFNTPKSWLVKNIKEIEKHIKENDIKKFVLKPIYSGLSSKVQILKSSDKAVVEKGKKYILQEFIEGKNICTYILANKGKIMAYSDYDADITIGIGASIFYKSLKNKNLFELMEKVIKSAKWNGQIAFDIIENKDEGFYLIECNPRLTSGICLFSDRDEIDQAFILNKNLITPYFRKAKSLKFLLILLGWRKAKSIKNWINMIKNSSDIVYMQRDIKPFFMQFFIFICSFYKAWKSRISIKKNKHH